VTALRGEEEHQRGVFEDEGVLMSEDHLQQRNNDGIWKVQLNLIAISSQGYVRGER
jgi:hypothetical protein